MVVVARSSDTKQVIEIEISEGAVLSQVFGNGFNKRGEGMADSHLP